MALRAYWKGSLKLSLVTCPVQLYPASTATAKTRFHMPPPRHQGCPFRSLDVQG